MTTRTAAAFRQTLANAHRLNVGSRPGATPPPPTERVFHNAYGQPIREIKGQGYTIHMPAASYSPRQNALSALVCAALADYTPKGSNR